ncbi:hypothetical protein [Fibrella aquatica]|uniref:hypothetical protein n=1 Tax=Fibrella aquatica TaxID=3242487 RepID=UPI003522DD7F
MKALPLLLTVGLSCTLLAVPSARLVAQQKTDKQPDGLEKTNPVAAPDFTTISKLTCGQTTDQAIRSLLGKPVSIASTGESTEWAYRFDKLNIRVQFDAQNKLTSCLYQQYDRNSSALDVRNIKSIRVGSNAADLVRLLGEPTYLSMSASGMEMAYVNAPDQTKLQVILSGKDGFTVTDYQFSVTAQRPLVIDSDKLTNIKKGQTTLSDVAAILGEPTQKTINKSAESWYYESADSRLFLRFNRDQTSTVVAYQYDQK